MRRTPLRSRVSARILTISATLGIALAMAGTPASLSAPPAGTTLSGSVSIEKVDGIFRGWPGDCPDELPAEPLVCHEWDITVYRIHTHDEPGDGAPVDSTWVLLALRHTLSFPGGDGEPEESDVGQGFRENADVDFDQQHLASATVRAPDLALSDGTTVDLEATWTATSPRFHWGNDGPALEEFGLVRHLKEECLNMVAQGHQNYRPARVDAVVDGVETSYTGVFAFLAFNQFIVHQTRPASCR
jgi:hypothetical protein